MSLTIHQSPTSPNQSNADLLYVLTSNTSSSPQFQFICDVRDTNDVLIQRLKQQPNPSDKAVFNVGQILTSQLTVDTPWTTTQIYNNISGAAEYKIVFGEEYANTVYSTPQLYNGITNSVTGSPALSSSNSLYVINGLVEPNSGDWNWDSSSFYVESVTPNVGINNLYGGLTLCNRTQSISNEDYHTITMLNGNLNGLPNSSSAWDCYMAQISVYSSSVLVDQTDLYNITTSGGGPRQNITQLWSDAYTSQSFHTKKQHWAAGPKNWPSTDFSDWDEYTLTFYPQQAPNQPNLNYVLDSYLFKKQQPCQYGRERFTWKNQLGGWDYYNFTMAQAKQTEIERIEYTQTQVAYNTNTNSVPYTYNRRGNKQLVNKLVETKQANTDWLTQQESDWLEELFYSTDVYVQSGSQYIPVTIIDTQVISKTNPRTQKTFQYQINYRVANQPKARQ